MPDEFDFDAAGDEEDDVRRAAEHDRLLRPVDLEDGAAVAGRGGHPVIAELPPAPHVREDDDGAIQNFTRFAKILGVKFNFRSIPRLVP